jgi:hypothetical protein
MRDVPRTTTRLVGVFATLVLLAGGLLAAVHAATSTTAVTADQAAVTAQAGMMKSVDVKEKGGTRLCQVGIVEPKGKKHTLHVDVMTNRAVQAK